VQSCAADQGPVRNCAVHQYRANLCGRSDSVRCSFVKTFPRLNSSRAARPKPTELCSATPFQAGYFCWCYSRGALAALMLSVGIRIRSSKAFFSGSTCPPARRARRSFFKWLHFVRLTTRSCFCHVARFSKVLPLLSVAQLSAVKATEALRVDGQGNGRTIR